MAVLGIARAHHGLRGLFVGPKQAQNNHQKFISYDDTLY